jgi:PAS domain S-box-containing protein
MSSSTTLTIGFTRYHGAGNPYWAIAEYAARIRARELGVTLVVRHSVSGSEQATAIQALIQQPVDAIIISVVDPNNPDFVAALGRATAAGIPLVVAASPIAYPVTCTVRWDEAQGLARAATYLAERLDGRGKVVHLRGLLHNPVAQLRWQGVHQVLDRFPEITIVAETDQADWQRELALPIMRAILEAHPDIRGVIAANDPMALGALDALAEVGRLCDVVVVGVDSSPHALLALMEGTLSATVRRPPNQIGRAVVDTTLAILQGNPVPLEILLDDMTLVTAETIRPALLDILQITPEIINELVASTAVLRAERSTLRTIIDSLPDLIYIKDRDSRFEATNQALAQLLGVPDPSALIGKTDFDFFPHDLATQYRADEQAVIQSGEPLLTKEEPVLDASGAERWYITTKVPVRDIEGQVIRLVGHGQDVTERRRAEEERRALERKLLEAQKLESLGVLAGGIAHDFNNLLVAILGNASLVLPDVAPGSPVREALEQIQIAAQRAADLTRQMLAYAGKGRFVIQHLDMNTIVEEMTQLLQASIPKTVALRYYLAPDLPAIEADATQIRQIAMNLVVNAAEAIGTKQGIISITTGAQWADREYLAEVYLAPELPEGRYVFVEVADTGHGMDAATRAKIFDPFFTTKFTGRGLGLAAVIGIVRGHKGALKVYSEPEKGTTFKILLPASAAATEAQVIPQQSAADWRGSGTVLVIDDEPDIRKIATRMLQRFGFTVLTAEDGHAGIEILQTQANSIVCVLLDMTMPHLDGPETFRLIRQTMPTLPVMLMSGYNEQEAISRFAGKGIAAFLPKPFTTKDLSIRLQSLFGS